MSVIHRLEGQTITAARVVHDYFQLSFEGDVYLSVYNDFSIEPERRKVEDLSGKVVIKIVESRNKLK